MREKFNASLARYHAQQYHTRLNMDLIYNRIKDAADKGLYEIKFSKEELTREQEGVLSQDGYCIKTQLYNSSGVREVSWKEPK